MIERVVKLVLNFVREVDGMARPDGTYISFSDNAGRKLYVNDEDPDNLLFVYVDLKTFVAVIPEAVALPQGWVPYKESAEGQLHGVGIKTHTPRELVVYCEK